MEINKRQDFCDLAQISEWYNPTGLATHFMGASLAFHFEQGRFLSGSMAFGKDQAAAFLWD